MINDKNKKRESVRESGKGSARDESRKAPEVNRSGKLDSGKLESGKSRENQAPNKFAHKSTKEETYGPKKSNVPESDTYGSYGD